jgi:hypothetical protein
MGRIFFSKNSTSGVKAKPCADHKVAAIAIVNADAVRMLLS